uniref:Uncharacterized protein n=1 Tax=Nelumbo nucifera TaxID=4432 RepID=A0A822XCU6_NELNU|nr:TPA_asm: hypothetical protein HUJ06_019613 [Nelumbo nucifera]
MCGEDGEENRKVFDEGWVDCTEDADTEEDLESQSSIGSVEFDKVAEEEIATTLNLETLFQEVQAGRTSLLCQ